MKKYSDQASVIIGRAHGRSQQWIEPRMRTSCSIEAITLFRIKKAHMCSLSTSNILVSNLPPYGDAMGTVSSSIADSACCCARPNPCAVHSARRTKAQESPAFDPSHFLTVEHPVQGSSDGARDATASCDGGGMGAGDLNETRRDRDVGGDDPVARYRRFVLAQIGDNFPLPVELFLYRS